jgi:uncharacterized protein YjbI with pentapeptide repeats
LPHQRVGALLQDFQEGAKSGVTKLLAAFFFRQYGRRASGDPTFVFTHKSFGEYLAALRIVRAAERVVRELKRRATNPDEGWDERDALKHWAQVCGPSPISQYLHSFFVNEMRLRPSSEIAQFQDRLAKLFGYLLRNGMPMEQLRLGSFKNALFQSRNAEEALLVALNACAKITERVSAIEHSDPTIFGAWFKRIQGQRSGPRSVLAAQCLSYLDLSEVCLDIGDFYGADFQHAKLRDLGAHYAIFSQADLSYTDLRKAILVGASLEGANLQGAYLQGANLDGANLEGANLRRTNLREVNLHEANLQRADLKQAKLEGANLKQAKLEGANLKGAKLGGSNLAEADTLPREAVRR